ncbi:MAG: hypothetical protein MJZ04_01885 [Bacteroidales bacterium]|nr:hypothetical protein [Bacteroidales bacterium]
MTSKAQRYATLLAQVRALAEGETDAIAVMANISAMVHREFGFWWTGFYIVRGEELVLGPFQGPVAVLDIDSEKLATFDEVDAQWLEKIVTAVPALT